LKGAIQKKKGRRKYGQPKKEKSEANRKSLVEEVLSESNLANQSRIQENSSGASK
jgi:hypothetical protein